MKLKMFISLVVLSLAAVPIAQAQLQQPYRIGVIYEGGSYNATVEGLTDGLRELGLVPGKDVLLEIRDLQGNRAAAGETARSLEQAKVDLLCSVGTSVTIPTKGATKEVPIVFVIGADAAAAGLVESPARPGGRLTGVQSSSGELVAKRLEIMKEMLPNLRRIVVFYDPNDTTPVGSLKSMREAAARLKLAITERRVASVEEFRRAFNALTSKDADAFVSFQDAMVSSQNSFIIDAANAKRLPTMFSDPQLVSQGALAGYGVSRHEQGRLMAKYVQRVLAGARPKDLPVETFSRYELGVNLQTARALGITIPQSVLFRADRVIE